MQHGGIGPGTPVGVVGGGAMGVGIAQVVAAAGHPVRLLEVDQHRADAAVARVRAGLRRAVDRGRLSGADGATAVEGLLATTEVADLAGCGLVVEAVAEDLAVKQAVLRGVEQVVDERCVLATNTSSLSLDALGTALASPSRLVGLHFFNPAPVLPLVEVVHALRSDPEVVDLAAATVTCWGKTAVRCASTPGFLVNRVARPFYSEALAVVEETGLAPAAVDRLFREAGGFRMGPLELTDLIGQDVNAAVTESVWRALHLDPRYRPSGLQRRLVDAGRLGRKSGRGFYEHRSDGHRSDEHRSDEHAAQTPEEHEPLSPPRVPDRPVLVGPSSALRPLLARTGCRFVEQPDLQAWARLPSGTLLALTSGELATAAARRLRADVVLLDLALDPATTTRVGAAASVGSPPGVLAEVRALLAAASVAVTPLPDVPGLLLARTVALLVDEAVDLAARQSVSPAELDRAVQLGLAYPLGPLAWGDRLGAERVVDLLDTLERLLPGGRFRVSTPLRRAALTGGSLLGR